MAHKDIKIFQYEIAVKRQHSIIQTLIKIIVSIVLFVLFSYIFYKVKKQFELLQQLEII